jgi:hypothetical protein
MYQLYSVCYKRRAGFRRKEEGTNEGSKIGRKKGEKERRKE